MTRSFESGAGADPGAGAESGFEPGPRWSDEAEPSAQGPTGDLASSERAGSELTSSERAEPVAPSYIATGSVAQEPRRAFWHTRPRSPHRRGLLWVIAPLLVLGLLTVVPFSRAVYDSFFRESLLAPDERQFIGLAGLASVLGNGTWWSAVGTSLAIIAIAVAAQLLLAAALAATLQRLTHGVPWLQALLLVPFALLAVVTATMLRDGLTAGFGPAWFGYDGASSRVGFIVIVLTEVWRGTGIAAVILVAGLRQVPRALNDSVIADGANAWQRLWRVTFPAALPALAVVVVFRALDALRALEAPLLTGGRAPTTAALLVWDATFETFEIGLGAVTSVCLIVIAALLGWFLARLFRMRSPL